MFFVGLLAGDPPVAQAVGMLGSVAQPIPLGPATGVQFANQFMGLVGGTVATTALIVRFFQKQGLGPAVAVSSGVLNTIATMIAQTILCIIGIAITHNDFTFAFKSNSSSGGGGVDVQTVGVIILALAVVARKGR